MEFKKFDITKSIKGKMVLILGARGKGKTVLAKDLLYHNQDFTNNYLFSPTERFAEQTFKNIFPDKNVQNDFSENVLDSIIKTQHTTKTTKKDRLVVMDNCCYDKGFVKSKSLLELFCNGRHLNIAGILTIPYPLSLPPVMRGNIDYIFISKVTILSYKKRIYECYASMFETFEEFCKVFDQITHDYTFFVIDNTVHSNTIQDCIFWYKAEMHDNDEINMLFDESLDKYEKSLNTTLIVENANNNIKDELKTIVDALAKLVDKMA